MIKLLLIVSIILLLYVIKKHLKLGNKVFLLSSLVLLVGLFLNSKLFYIIYVGLFIYILMQLYVGKISKRKLMKFSKGYVILFIYLLVLVIISVVASYNRFYSTAGIINSIFLCIIAFLLMNATSREIGIKFKSKTYLITNFKRVIPGINGGISFKGSVSGFIIGLVYLLIISIVLKLGIGSLLISLVLGISGTFIDSFLGATLQSRKYVTNEMAKVIVITLLINVALIFNLYYNY